MFRIFYISTTNPWKKLPQDVKNLHIIWKDSFHVLSNNFSYAELSFLFLLQKDSYYLHDDTTLFSFSSSERFWYISWTIFRLFLLLKDFGIFRLLLFQAFLCVFGNIYLTFLYTEKIIKNIFIIFLFFYISLTLKYEKYLSYVSYMSHVNYCNFFMNCLKIAWNHLNLFKMLYFLFSKF